MEVAVRLDEAMEQAARALEELTGLADLPVVARSRPPVDYVRAMAETLLLVLVLAGAAGLTREELAAASASRIGHLPSAEDLARSLSRLTDAGEIVESDGRWLAARVRRPRRSHEAPTVADLIVEVLRDAAAPLTPTEIRHAIGARGHTIARTTIQPILGRMGRAGRLVHVHTRWSLPTEAKTR